MRMAVIFIVLTFEFAGKKKRAFNYP